MGRPQKPIDKEVVKRLATLGVSGRLIAKIFGVSDDTIQRRFAGVIREKRTPAVGNVVFALYNAAIAGDVAAIRYYLTVIGGFDEEKKIQVTGADGGPLQVNNFIQWIHSEIESEEGESEPSQEAVPE